MQTATAKSSKPTARKLSSKEATQAKLAKPCKPAIGTGSAKLDRTLDRAADKAPLTLVDAVEGTVTKGGKVLTGAAADAARAEVESHTSAISNGTPGFARKAMVAAAAAKVAAAKGKAPKPAFDSGIMRTSDDMNRAMARAREAKQPAPAAKPQAKPLRGEPRAKTPDKSSGTWAPPADIKAWAASHAGHRIHILVPDPMTPGSKAAKRFALIKENMTVAQARDAGVDALSLAFAASPHHRAGAYIELKAGK